MVFKVVSCFFMVLGWFPWFFKVSRWIFIVINGPRLVKSWPHDPTRPCRLWPSDDDDDDGDDGSGGGEVERSPGSDPQPSLL